MRYGYARAAHGEPIGLQLKALRKAGCEEIYTDGTEEWKRPRGGWDVGDMVEEVMWGSLAECLSELQAGDTLIIYRLDRIGRSWEEVKEIAKRVRKKEAHLMSLSEGIDTSTTGWRVATYIWAMTVEEGWGHDWPHARASTDIPQVKSLMESGEAEEACDRYGIASPTLYQHIHSN